MLLPFVYIGAFIVLLLHQSRFIFGGDSAEFSLVARTWSVSHPPGYPFYSLLINIFNRLIPFGTTPWKIATISSLSTVGASFLIYLVLRKLKINTPIALFASLFYIILFPIWEYSEIPEVFALNNLLSVAITYSVLLFSENRKSTYFYAAALLCGLAVSHHHIFVLFVPGWIYLLLRKQGKDRPVISLLKKRTIVISLLLFLLGFSFYVYAPIASSFSPPINWENASTLSGFLRLITRATYGTFKAYNGSSGDILNQLFDLFSLFVFLAIDFRAIGIILILFGAVALRNKRSGFSAFLFISTALHIFFLFYTNFVLSMPFTVAMYERFLIPLYMIFVFFLAFGIQSIERALKAISQKYIQNGSLRRLVGYFVPVFMTVYFLIVSLQNYQTIRLIPNTDIFAVYAKNLLDTPPKNSIFFVGADNSYFTTVYYYFGEHYRPDLKFIFVNQLENKYYRDYVRKKFPDVYVPEPYTDKKDLNLFLEKNKPIGLYLENPFGPSWKPYGLLWKQYDSEEEAIADSNRLVQENSHLWEQVYTIPRLNDSLKKILHMNVVLGTYLNDYLNYSRLLFGTNHIDKARQVVAHLSELQKGDMRTKFILVNLYLYQNDCAKAGQVVESVPFREALQNQNILPSLLDYYMKCRPGDTDSIKKITDTEKSSRESISSL